ncbi:MAG: ATP-dependent nuclease [Fusobacteriaceae bacterium]
MIIGLYLRHIKAYRGIYYIPIGYKYKFASYLGGNGIGKSSILEALNSFFNNKNYLINNIASSSIHSKNNEGFVTPIFFIEKEKVTKSKSDFKKISDFFWNLDPKTLPSKTRGGSKDFFDIRNKLRNDGHSSETHYLFVLGDNVLVKKELHFGPFQSLFNKDKEEVEEKAFTSEPYDLGLSKDFLNEVKKLFSFVYLPVELEATSFTKIESEEMQKIFNKELKAEIEKALMGINLDKSDGINIKLEKFIKSIECTLDGEYIYGAKQKNKKNLTKIDLVEKILEVYFQQRILYKTDSKGNKKIDDLSAGEKRQALVSIVYAFLKKKSNRNKSIIVGIDEPESSLHSSNCFEQFEKLKEISSDNQILVTTHWYGHLPILSKGYCYFLENNIEGNIKLKEIDLYNYREDLNGNLTLKSMNDLVQSIFYSLIQPEPYNWIICEGISEKIYFEYFFREEIAKNKLRILPMNGFKDVLKLFKYLHLPIETEIKNSNNGKVFCLVDTDIERKEPVGTDTRNMKLRRLLNIETDKTILVELKDSRMIVTDIEQSLNPIVFKETLQALNPDPIYLVNEIKNVEGNSSFIENFENLKLKNYFKLNSGEQKIIFAKKYIEISNLKENADSFEPNWIRVIKSDLLK